MKRKQQNIINRAALAVGIAVAVVTATLTGAMLQGYFVGELHKTPDLHQLFTIINQERAAAGEPPVLETALLDASAEAHCNDMVNLDYYSHYSPQGNAPTYWMAQQHITWKHWGENINYSYKTAQVVAQMFYISPEHKANTLNPGFNQVGLAECSPQHYPDLVVEQFVQTP